MSAERALESVRARLRVRMNELADDLACGQAKDFPEYRKACGVIEGLAYAECEIIDLATKLKDSDDD